MRLHDPGVFGGSDVKAWMRLALKASGMTGREIEALLFSSAAERRTGESAVNHLARFEAFGSVSESATSTVLLLRYQAAVQQNAGWTMEDLDRELAIFDRKSAAQPRDLLETVERLDKMVASRVRTMAAKEQTSAKVLRALADFKEQMESECATCGSDEHPTSSCLEENHGRKRARGDGE